MTDTEQMLDHRGAHARPEPDTDDAKGHARRWWVLAVLGIAQLMVVLDATIVNIALPRAQEALAFDNADRQWIVTAYSLAFGSLLLLGGRLGDLVGRKRTLMIGLAGFAVASAVGGAAQSFDVLVIARAAQGAFAALLAPAALSLLSTTFTDKAERGKAFGIFGAIAGGGGAVGLLLGGTLTEYLSWRWCLYVNLAFAAVALVGGMILLSEKRPDVRPHLDVKGTITVTLALVGIVYGFSHAETDGWLDGVTIASLVAGVVLLAVFVALQARVPHPLMPLRIFASRNRSGALIAILVSGAGMFGVFLFLTYYLQALLGYTPVETGLAFLPMVAALMVAATVISPRVLDRFGPKAMVATGLLIAAGGMALFTQLGLESTYVSGILPGLLVVGFGLGLVIAPSTNVAVSGVLPEDASIASALFSTMQQVGGSIGTALLSTLAASAASDYLVGRTPSADVAAHAQLESYLTAFGWSAVLFAVGGVIVGLMLRRGPIEAAPEGHVALG